MIKIIGMDKKHIAQVHNIEKVSFSKPWSEKALESALESKGAYFVVAVEGDNVLGYGGVHILEQEAYIDNIAVDEKIRNTGIGKMIVENLVDKAREKAAFISLEVRESSNAVRLYMRLGFEEAGKRKDFYSEPRESALILTKYFS